MRALSWFETIKHVAEDAILLGGPKGRYSVEKPVAETMVVAKSVHTTCPRLSTRTVASRVRCRTGFWQLCANFTPEMSF